MGNLSHARRFTVARRFLDTNILVYAFDVGNPKQSRAEALIRQALLDGSGVISTQVMQEFYVNAVRKLNLPPEEASAFVHDLRNMDVVTITADMIEEAMAASTIIQVSFWDALILVAAKTARCSSLITEDLSHGSRLLGVRIENPF